MSREDGVTPLFDGVEMPGHGYAPRVESTLRPLSSWARLQSNQELGKKVVLVYDAESEVQQEAMTMFELQGGDLDACQLQVTLVAPMVIPRTVADLGYDIQNQTGEFDNAQVGAEDFPGTSEPIAWPPFVAIVRWGVGSSWAEMMVDFVNGTTINVPASAVRVFAAVAPDAINQPGTSGAYVLSCFVGPGQPRGTNAQRTICVGSLAVDEESDVLVTPKFAKTVTVIGADPAAGVPQLTAAYIRFWQSPDGTNCVGNYYINGNQPTSFPVPNGGQYFTIVSGMGITCPFSACFQLAA